jgi:hypothetical protein
MAIKENKFLYQKKRSSCMIQDIYRIFIYFKDFTALDYKIIMSN